MQRDDEGRKLRLAETHHSWSSTKFEPDAVSSFFCRAADSDKTFAPSHLVIYETLAIGENDDECENGDNENSGLSVEHSHNNPKTFTSSFNS